MTVEKEGLFRWQLLSDRERKNLVILDLIRKNGSISRTEVSRVTGLNIVTVSNYINNYIDKSLVLEKGLDVSSGGRKPALVELNSKGGYVIGVDIGPGEIFVIMTDLGIKPISKIKVKRPKGNMEEVVYNAIPLIQEVIDKSKIELAKIKCIGVGVSGVIDEPGGTIKDTDPARGCTSVDFLMFINDLKKRFGTRTFIGNDATCAAFGEKRLNPKADVDDLLYVYSDIGCGIVIKGEVYCGAGGAAGEIQISPDVETKEYAFLRQDRSYLRPWGIDLGIAVEAKKIVEKGIGTLIVELADGNVDNITKDVVIEAAKRNDRIAIELIENAAVNLGVRVAYLINLFNPEVVVIGGGVEKAGEIFWEPLRRTIKNLAFEQPASLVKVVPSILGEDAVCLGAASLAIRELFIEA